MGWRKGMIGVTMHQILGGNLDRESRFETWTGIVSGVLGRRFGGIVHQLIIQSPKNATIGPSSSGTCWSQSENWYYMDNAGLVGRYRTWSSCVRSPAVMEAIARLACTDPFLMICRNAAIRSGIQR
jgi:hypothetical protein